MLNDDYIHNDEKIIDPAASIQNLDSKKEESNVVYYNVYDHGFTNGILKVPKEHFEGFITAIGQKILAKKELGLTLREIETQKLLLEHSRQQLLELSNTLSSNEFEIAKEQETQLQLEVQINEEKEQKNNLVQEREKVLIEYNWFNIWLFIVIGFVFVFSDFYITYDVLRNGLNLEVVGAIALAIAVSGITFVIKPTIDRLFEKPYLRDAKKNQHRLLISVSIASVVVLGLLGYYREEYFRQSQKREALQREVKTLNKQIEDARTRAENCARRGDLACVQRAKSEINQFEDREKQIQTDVFKIIQEIGGNIVLYFVFIISNILFALAGAICFSIAFPAYDRLRLKIRQLKQIDVIENRISKFRLAGDAIRDRIKNCQIALNQASNAIKLLPPLNAVEQEIFQLQERATILLKTIAEQEAKADISLYHEAYERGKICEFNDKIIFTPNQIGAFIRKGSNTTQRRGPRNPLETGDNNRALGQEIEFDDRYLHQQIRSLIEYNHQNKKHLLNGEDE